jgi:hypothetical protein
VIGEYHPGHGGGGFAEEAEEPAKIVLNLGKIADRLHEAKKGSKKENSVE